MVTDDLVHVGIIVNPKHARTTRAYADLVRRLRAQRIRYRSFSTTPQRSGAWQASDLIAWGADIVIILGGDGTIRAAAPVLAAAETPVMLVPTGTANVLSRHVGIRSHRHAIATCVSHAITACASRAIAACAQPGSTREIGVPINDVEYLDVDGHWQRSHFICLAGLGGDARAVAEHGRAPGLLGYALGGVRALFAPSMDARIDAPTAGVPDTNGAPSPRWSIMASKVARPAGPIPVFPQARIDADDFSFLSVGPLAEEPGDRLGDWARIAAACLQGRPGAPATMNYRTGRELTIGLDSPEPAHLDGDPIGDCLGMRISAGTTRLRVLVPEAED
ncbi:diacylglycerol/lipid kinase family protein [Brevibacterium sp. GP-SGM9]|uniref:diacylglycerol/lipid kinase family protein n=1 Tax=Brevibacterium sp. GP-SGM9 TaxID=3376990 RepID=UPI0039A75849